MTPEFLAAYRKHKADLVRVMTAINEDANASAVTDSLERGDTGDRSEFAAVFAPYVAGFLAGEHGKDMDIAFATKMTAAGMVAGSMIEKETMQ